MTLNDLISKIDDDNLAESIMIQVSSDFRKQSGVKEMVYSCYDRESIFEFENTIKKYGFYEVEKIRFIWFSQYDKYMLINIKRGCN